MLGLSVHIYQVFTNLGQQIRIDIAAVHTSDIAPVAPDFPAQCDGPIFLKELFSFQDCSQVGLHSWRYLKDCFHIRAFCFTADHHSLSPAAQEYFNSVDNDGFPRTGFTSKGDQARRELEL